MLRSLFIAALANCALVAAAPREGYAPVFFTQAPTGYPGDLRYLVNTSGLTAWFSPTEVRIRTGGVTVGLSFEGANPAPRIEGMDSSPGKTNFLLGEERNWSLNLPTFARIVYRGLYPGIDMVYSGGGQNLKSEFVVAPGADPMRIRVRYSGGGRLRISDRGEFAVPTGSHELREQAPVIYQLRGEKRLAVSGRFSLAADDTVGFTVNDYDRSLPLVIDPVVYSTYLGGGNSDAALSMAVDAAGSAYIAGFTASTNLATVNPRQALNAGGNDIFVAKLNPAGNGLVYCTYIGGSGDDRAFGIALDSSGAVFVVGSTTSKNFPLLNALQSKNNGLKNAFVLKLNATGNALSFSSYLGGNGSDTATGVSVDAAGNPYVTGDSTSPNFPTTVLQRSNRGGQDAFVAKLSPAGALLYSTYLGGAYDDHAAAVAVGPGGSAYVTGSTYSTDFPLANALQSAPGGGQDAFVARLSSTGDSLLFSTFLGGAGGGLGAPEAGQAIAVDAQGGAYIAGVTTSADFPLVQPLQSSRWGSQDAFIARFNSSGVLVYSTYLGGSGIDAANAIAVDSKGAATIAGQTFSSDLPVLDAVQSSQAGDYDAFYATLAPSGTSLTKLGYLGGHGSDTATSVALDTTGNIFLAGWTLSTDFPLANAYQSINAGSYGAFIVKVSGGFIPTVGSVTPSSGTGSSQAFSFSFSDSGGAANLASVSVLFSAGGSTSNACSVTYNRAANTLILLTDAGAAPGSSITPGSGSQQNSQCVLNGSGSGVSVSGNLLTLTLALNFQSAFTGAKTIFAQAVNPIGSTGWQQTGSWTVPAPVMVPVPIAVTPASGSGTSQTFTFTFSDSRGYAAISSVSFLVNPSLTKAGSCYILFYRSSNTLYLAADAASAWLSPIVLGTSSSTQNSQCTVQAAGSSSAGSGNNLTVTLALQFRTSFSGAKNIYMEAFDGADSGWQQRGVWTVPATAQPVPVSVTPASGNVSSGRTFTFAFSDFTGYAAISSVSILVNSTQTTAGGCYILFYRSSNTLYLANDASSAWLSPIVLGTSSSTQNSQCTVQAASSSATGSGTDLTISLAITFQTAFNGDRKVYMEAYNGLDSGWVQRGAWTVSAVPVLSPVSVTPSSGAGSSQPFGFVFTDPSGYAAIQSTSILINSALIGPGGCYLLYYRASNTLYLANDAATQWLTPITLGGPGTTQNSQCIVTAAGSSSAAGGNNLTLTLSIAFQPAVHGARNIYMEVYDGKDSGWQQKGTWTIP